jgi:hypothetical protein
MAVPFAKMKAAVTAVRKEYDVRDILNKLAKALVGKYSYKVMQDYDKRMVDLSLNDAGTAFMSCIPENPLMADLYIDTGNPVSIITLLKGDTQNKDIRSLLMRFAKSAAVRSEAVVVFRVKHLGVWVAYNTADPIQMSVPRLILPSNTKGQNAITIMPMTTYIKMWDTKRGDLENGRQ